MDAKRLFVINKKILVLLTISGIAIVGVLLYVTTNDSNPKYGQIAKSNTGAKSFHVNKEDFTKIFDIPEMAILRNEILYIHIKHSDDVLENRLFIPLKDLLFINSYYKDERGNLLGQRVTLDPNNTKTYDEIGYRNSSKSIAFVYPIFTQAAYSSGGFYDYYRGDCDSRCLTIKIPPKVIGKYTSSINGAAVLSLLNYPYLTDIDIDKNPAFLKKYDRIIMLHNEYVTKREFDAVTNHPDVIYLYPNALYAEISVDYEKNSITLVKGHTYPTKDISNGFNWKFDNSKYEYDNVCDNWQFQKIDNGKMLDCYPGYRMYYDKKLFLALKE